MVRRFLLYLSAAAWARGMMTHFFLARRVARRFIAGETLDDAMQAVRDLNAQGMLVTLDYLGESVSKAEDTQGVVAMYRAMLDRIDKEHLKAGVSLKLTHFGLDITEDLCVTNLRTVLTDAKAHHIPVTIDMESSAYVDKTLRIYRTMRDEYEFTNLGTVIQAYLYRTKEDMRHLAREGATIRLVKGAYLEPETVAYPQKSEVDANYQAAMIDYLQAPPPAYLQIATHDETLIQAAEKAAKDHQIAPERFEFQMLYGIRSQRQAELAKSGYQMRIYVPFGEAWYPYFMRRLAERPANLWFFVRSLFRA
ncbi:MAG TPA: proline dehydrogenase family protein [Phototrophicaceae bacterium]|nr:proline dehydrogenase family protein [Phototrophicaceae bacterium]